MTKQDLDLRLCSKYIEGFYISRYIKNGYSVYNVGKNGTHLHTTFTSGPTCKQQIVDYINNNKETK